MMHCESTLSGFCKNPPPENVPKPPYLGPRVLSWLANLGAIGGSEKKWTYEVGKSAYFTILTHFLSYMMHRESTLSGFCKNPPPANVPKLPYLCSRDLSWLVNLGAIGGSEKKWTYEVGKSAYFTILTHFQI